MAILSDTYFEPTGKTGLLPFANDNDYVASAFGAFPQWEQPPMDYRELLRQAFMQQQPPVQPQAAAGAPAGGGYAPPPRMEELNQPAPQQAVPQQFFQAPPNPSIGDRLNAGLMGFANGGAPIPALANLISGLVTGQRGDKIGYEQQIMNATYNAALKSGATPAQAIMLATNPQAAQALMPKIMEGGSDPLSGEKSFVAANPLSGQITPASVAGQPAGAGTTAPTGFNSLLAQLDAAKKQGASREQLLQLLPPGYRDDVKAMVERRGLPTNLGRANLRPILVTLAHALDENFNETELPGQVQAFKSWTSGKDAETVRNLRQTLYHGSEELLKAFDNLNNSQYPIYNAAGNLINTQLGKSGVQDFQMNAHAFASELSKIYKQANLSDSEINAWEKTIGENMSPEQQQAVMKKAVGLLEGGLRGLQQKRLEAVGAQEDARMPPIVGKEQLELIKRMRNWVPKGLQPKAPASSKPDENGWVTINGVKVREKR